MISISGIKYQKELESLPYFNKNQASLLIDKKSKNLDKKIEQLKKIGYLLTLKKGLYVTFPFYDKIDKKKYFEFLANVLRSPAYISQEYVLAETGLIPEAPYSQTAITIKSSRIFKNFLGSFVFKNIKKELFTGFKTISGDGGNIYKATKAKALFDFLYLRPFKNPKQEIAADLRINWDNFEKKDLLEFERYVKLSNSKKMFTVLKIISKNLYVS